MVPGLLLIGLVANDDGLFAAAGNQLARVARSGGALFVGATVIIGLATATLNLDTSVAFLTPALAYTARGRGRGPLLYGCLLLSNAGSLFLVGSNLTNLIVLSQLRFSGAGFLARMWAPAPAALVVTATVAAAFGHRALRVSAKDPGPPQRPVIVRPGDSRFYGLVRRVVDLLRPAGLRHRAPPRRSSPQRLALVPRRLRPFLGHRLRHPVPAGAGFRDVVLVALLSIQMSVHDAAAITLVSRVATTAVLGPETVSWVPAQAPRRALRTPRFTRIAHVWSKSFARSRFTWLADATREATPRTTGCSSRSCGSAANTGTRRTATTCWTGSQAAPRRAAKASGSNEPAVASVTHQREARTARPGILLAVRVFFSRYRGNSLPVLGNAM